MSDSRPCRTLQHRPHDRNRSPRKPLSLSAAEMSLVQLASAALELADAPPGTLSLTAAIQRVQRAAASYRHHLTAAS